MTREVNMLHRLALHTRTCEPTAIPHQIISLHRCSCYRKSESDIARYCKNEKARRQALALSFKVLD